MRVHIASLEFTLNLVTKIEVLSSNRGICAYLAGKFRMI
jgi:hypothetical protein